MPILWTEDAPLLLSHGKHLSLARIVTTGCLCGPDEAAILISLAAAFHGQKYAIAYFHKEDEVEVNFFNSIVTILFILVDHRCISGASKIGKAPRGCNRCVSVRKKNYQLSVKRWNPNIRYVILQLKQEDHSLRLVCQTLRRAAQNAGSFPCAPRPA